MKNEKSNDKINFETNKNSANKKLEFLVSLPMRLVEYPVDRFKKMNASRSLLIPSIFREYKKWPLVYLLAFLQKRGKVKIKADKSFKKEILITLAIARQLPYSASNIKKIGKELGYSYRKAKDREILAHALLDHLSDLYHFYKTDDYKDLVNVLAKHFDVEWTDEQGLIKIEFEERRSNNVNS